jgi:hypothetical protein
MESGVDHDMWQVGPSFNCINPDFCEELGGFWGWVEFRRRDADVGDAEFAFCAHSGPGGGFACGGHTSIEIESWTIAPGSAGPQTFYASGEQTDSFRGTKTTFDVTNEDTGISAVPGHYSTSDVLGFEPRLGWPSRSRSRSGLRSRHCTPRVRVAEVGGTIPCTISLGSKRQAVRTVVDNLDGTVHFEPATLWPVTPPKPATGKIGDKLTVYDEAGAAQLEATVTRLKFSAGDEFDHPIRGVYMGANVTLRALADGQDLVEITAVVGGRKYSGDAIVTSTAFDPPLDPVILDRGEQASGWLVFDVPARHGQLVMHDLDGHQLGAWKY